MLFNLTFERPIGAAADVRELEYIASLHQTSHDVAEEFLDASIDADDVETFLMSRHGIKVTREEVQKLVFGGLAGGDSDDDCIDIVEVVAILLIPYLVKTVMQEQPEALNESLFTSIYRKTFTKAQDKLKKLEIDSTSMVSDVLGIILEDTTGSDTPQPLTKDLLRKIFARYDELDLIKDENLIDEMIQVATGGDPDGLLDPDAFARALTSDVGLYDVNTESRVSTHYQDVFGALGEKKDENESITDSDDDEFVDNDVEDKMVEKTPEERTVTKVFTFSQIDFLSDTFRVRFHFILTWVAFIVAYASYANILYSVDLCKGDSFGCAVGGSIVSWLTIMAILVCIGFPTITLLSMGNTVQPKSVWEMIAGICSVVLIIFVPVFINFEFKLFGERIFYTVAAINDEVKEDAAAANLVIDTLLDVVNIAIGCALILLQLWNIVRFYNVKIATSTYQGSCLHDEFGTKQASKLKVFRMVKNAYDLHKASDNEVAKNYSSNSIALLNYNKIVGGECTKTVGGFKWIWKAFRSGKLSSKEGIWIPSRLFAGNIAQILASFAVFGLGVVILNSFVADLEEARAAAAVASEIASNSTNATEASECYAFFNASDCYYPKDEVDEYFGVAICPEVFLPTCDTSMEELSAGVPNSAICGLLMESPYASYLTATGFECPTIFVSPLLNPIYAVTEGSNETTYCSAPITGCAINPGYYPGGEMGTCVLGMQTFVANQFSGELCSSYEEIGAMANQSGVDLSGLSKIIDQDWNLYPWQVQTSASIGLTVALLISITSGLGYIPSIVITILKFRTGVIPSLRDPNFIWYRTNLHRTTTLLGSMFWGAFISTLLLSLLISGFIFVCVWQITQPTMIRVLATIIGVIITILLKMIIVISFSRSHFAGFYRKRNPAVGNIINLLLECWNIGVTTGYVLVRVIKILIITFIYIGRFDTELLSRDANKMGNVYLDGFPLVLRQDLLSTDSHRHPYIERLGLMYMYKLKYGDRFAKKSGSIWRLLFVFALMPWLRKYRISNTEDIDQAMISDMFKSVKNDDSEVNALKQEISSLKEKLKGKERPNTGLSSTGSTITSFFELS